MNNQNGQQRPTFFYVPSNSNSNNNNNVSNNVTQFHQNQLPSTNFQLQAPNQQQVNWAIGHGMMHSGQQPIQVPSSIQQSLPQQQPGQSQQQQNQYLPHLGTYSSGVSDQLFGILNEQTTNLESVPTDFRAVGQNFSFHHGRFFVPGMQVKQALSQPGSFEGNLRNLLLSQEQLHPMYQPNFVPPSHPPAPPVYTYVPVSYTAKMLNVPTVQAQVLPKDMLYSHQHLGSTVLFPHVNKQPEVANIKEMVSKLQESVSANISSSSTLGGGNVQKDDENPVDDDSSPQTRRRSSKRTLTKMQQQQQEPQSPRAAPAPAPEPVVVQEDFKRKRKKRDPTLPKPARFAWNFYFRDQYTKIRNSEPSEHNNVQKAFTEIGFDLGKKWKSLSPEEKEPYIKLAAQDKIRYENEMRSRFSNPSSVARGSDSNSEEEEENKVGIVVSDFVVQDERTEEEKKDNSNLESELIADILVVDDDEVFLKIIRHKLVVGKRNPPKVVTVTSASEARRMIVDENKKFGAVLLDKDFGEGKEDGLCSLSLIRESGYKGMILGVTGSEDVATSEEFASKGANETLFKGRTDFYQALNDLITVHSKQAEMAEEGIPESLPIKIEQQTPSEVIQTTTTTTGESSVS